jgi:PST family polysaccharide transporter
MTIDKSQAAAEPSPPEKSLREQVVRGGAFMMVRQIVLMGLSLIGVLVVTRTLGPDRYGPYAAAIGIYQYLQILGQAGIGVYLVRAPEPVAARDYRIASTLLLLLGLSFMLVIELARPLLGGWIRVNGFDALLGVLLLVLPFQTMSVAASAKLERALDFRRIAIIEMGSQVFYYAVVLPLVLLTPAGTWALVVGYCCQQIAVTIVLHIVARHVPKPAWDWAKVRSILGYTIGFSAASWIYQLRSLVNPLIVGHFLGDGAVGVVGIAIRLLDMLAFAKTIAWRLSVAALARVQDDREKLIEALTHGMQLQMLAIAPVVLGFGWFGGLVLPIMFGERWLPVMTIYPYIAVSYLTNAQFNVHSSVLYVRRRNWDVAAFHLVHVGLFALGAWFGIQRAGLVGYGWGEMAGLAGYVLLHRSIVRLLGSPDYRLSSVWWLATVIGLFWQQLGYWAMAVPFAALVWPRSIRQLTAYGALIRRRAVA